jgi:hypothetical protein
MDGGEITVAGGPVNATFEGVTGNIVYTNGVFSLISGQVMSGVLSGFANQAGVEGTLSGTTAIITKAWFKSDGFQGPT